MEIPKKMVVEQIRSRGDFDQISTAERELPEKVDAERDAELLTRFGVDVAALVEAFGDQSPAVS